MATRGAQPGNKNAGHDKPWAAAIRRAVMRASSAKDKAQKLDRLAEKLIDEGLAGNTMALKEIGDRLDGKPAQAIEGGDPTKPIMQRIETVIVDPQDVRSPKA